MLGIRTGKVAVFLLPRTIEADSPAVHVHCKFLTNITRFITGFPAPVAGVSFMYMAAMLSSFFRMQGVFPGISLQKKVCK
jgi:hypothetical protein